MLKLLFFLVRVIAAFEYVDFIKDNMYFMRDLKQLYLNETHFSSLEGYQVNAENALEKDYPWIAQVIHSRSDVLPYMCTAVCIDEGIFITAARCIHNLKVKILSVLYKDQLLPVRAYVLPSKPTCQAFDDIGFIIIDEKLNGTYDVIKLFDSVKRTDETFQWFRNMDLSGPYKVVGYTVEKGLHRVRIPERIYNLSELSIVINFDLCSTIYTKDHRIDGFGVSCYHSCTIEEFKTMTSHPKCSNYHGVEGAAVINTKTNQLFGLAIWGAYFPKYELPVGFSVVNSNNFYEDYECAKKIRDVDTIKSISGFYQHFCD